MSIPAGRLARGAAAWVALIAVLVGAPVLLAVTIGWPLPHTLPAVTQASRHMRDDQIRASKLIGSAVYDPTDQKIGTIDELVLNADGKVADVVLGVGGFLGAGEKRVAVPMADLKRGKNDHFVLAATKDSLKQMANFEFKTASTAGSGSSAHK